MCRSALQNWNVLFKTGRTWCCFFTLVLPLYPAVVHTSLDFKQTVHFPRIEISNVKFDDNYCFRCVSIPYVSYESMTCFKTITILSLTEGLILNSLFCCFWCKIWRLLLLLNVCLSRIFHINFQLACHYWRIGADLSLPPLRMQNLIIILLSACLSLDS